MGNEINPVNDKICTFAVKILTVNAARRIALSSKLQASINTMGLVPTAIMRCTVERQQVTVTHIAAQAETSSILIADSLSAVRCDEVSQLAIVTD